MVTNLGSDDLTSATSATRDQWQEPLSRWHTVPASKVAQAAEIIRGMAGSWAASYQLEYGVKNESRSIDSKVGNPPQVKSSHLGKPGFPEINFVPYNYGTNRFGSKGGSLVGHPISFEIIGPTARNDASGFYWDVVQLADIDELTNSAGTFANIYGHSLISDFPSGLYMVITQTGSPGALVDEVLGGFPGGIGDGCDLNGAKNGIVPITANSKYEIFRVVSIRNSTIVLDTNKRLSSYFTVPADPIVQSVMFVQPKATRLLAVPGSGTTGATSKVFATTPPKRAATQDDQYKYSTWSGAPWSETNLPQYTLGTGTTFEYKYGPKLPIPRPIGYWHGRLRGIDPATGAAEAPLVTQAGTFILYPRSTDPGYTAASMVGKIIHINNVQSRNGAVMHPDSTATASDFKRDFTALMGWFEVIGWSGAYHTFRRVSETDPTTGFPVIGSSLWYTVESSGVPANDMYKTIEVDATVHNPIESLWTNSYADIDTIQSARLSNLIDPRWVERSPKSATGGFSVHGMDPGRADRSIFDTSSSKSGSNGYNADPGSLLDMGFRMVLFPAKMGTELDPAGGADLDVVVPDWDHPVASNEVLLDPAATTEKQYIEVDYANGLVRLSHSIKSGSSLYPTDASVLTATDNPRKEMVLFACCVPYSQEEGQLGAGGVRVLGGQSFQTDAASSCADLGVSESTDVFSSRITATVSPTSGVAGIVSSENHISGQVVVLDGDWVYKIPPSGFFELLSGDSTSSPAAIGDTYYRGSLFGYNSVTINAGRTLTTLVDVYGGGDYGTDTVDTNNPTVAVFRREVVTPNDTTGRAGVSYQYDTTYGSAKRTPVLRFDDSDVVANMDGTVTVKQKTAEAVGTLNDVLSSWVLEVGSITRVVGGGTVDVTVQPHVVIMRGHRITVPVSTTVLNADGTYYIYYEHNDGTTCPQLLSTVNFPLPHPEDILLTKLVVSGGVTAGVLTTLQNPLNDVDRRVDLYVGELGGTTSDWAAFKPHFKTLYEAVEYANELMNPDSGGRAYQNIRIRVVGRTQEPTVRLPIVIRTDGLVIEGSPFYDSNPAVAVTSEISWGARPNITDLIDINGHSDLVFRNLSFRSNQQASNAACTAAVFTSTGDPSAVVIDNCRVSGFVNYFVNLNAVTSASGFKITNNTVMSFDAKTGTASGVSAIAAPAGANLPMPPILGFVISGNYFNSATDDTRRGYGVNIRSVASVALPTEFMDTLQINDGIVIGDNVFNDFTTAIWATTQHGEISNNVVNRTLFEGFITAGGWSIRNNRLIDIHHGGATSPTVLTANRTGILQFTYQRVAGGVYDMAIFPAVITGNRVELDHDVHMDVATDKAIVVLGSPNVLAGFTLIRSGTAQAGAFNQIRLDAGASSITDYYVGGTVTFTNNSPVGVSTEKLVIIAYNGSTKWATVANIWGTTPDVTSNFRIDRLNRGSGEIVENNHAGYAANGQSMLNLSNIRVNASDAKVSNNNCASMEVWGTDCNISGNIVAHMCVNYDLNAADANPDRALDDTNTMIGNTVEVGFYPWNKTKAIGNHFIDAISVPADVSGLTLCDNTFDGILVIPYGSDSTMSGNTFDGGLSIGATTAATKIRITNNILHSSMVVGDVAHVANGCIVANNQLSEFTGALGFTVYANLSTVQGNNTLYDGATKFGFLVVTGGHNTIEGNSTGEMTIAGGQNITKGNKFFGDMTITAAGTYNVIADNCGLVAGKGYIKIYSSFTVITGNMVNDIWLDDSLTNSVMTGNMVVRNIRLSGATPGQTDPVVIVGNIATVIAANAAKANSAIVAANQATTVFGGATVAGTVNVNNAGN